MLRSSKLGAHQYQNGTYSVLTKWLNGTYYGWQRCSEKRGAELRLAPRLYMDHPHVDLKHLCLIMGYFVLNLVDLCLRIERHQQ